MCRISTKIFQTRNIFDVFILISSVDCVNDNNSKEEITTVQEVIDIFEGEAIQDIKPIVDNLSYTE